MFGSCEITMSQHRLRTDEQLEFAIEKDERRSDLMHKDTEIV